jgi:methyltransferase (TIGR00027 family)
MAGEPPKNRHRGTPGFLLKFFQVALYIPIQVAFIPFAVVGLVDGIFKEIIISRRLDVSFTAIKALQYRWIMHYFDTRPDPISVAFTKKLPCESHFSLWSTFGALIISQRLFGFTTIFGRVAEPGKETPVSTAGSRVLMFDAIVEKYVDDVEQIVIPGAGFDLVALHFTKAKNTTVFELDQTGTLQVKLETLKKAGIAHDWITYVPVDYSTESWSEKLLAAGFDKTKKTLFLWQSVSLFLEAGAVKKTLREMAGLCAGGSIIAQDLYSKAFISGETSRIVKRSLRMLDKMGEPWRFGVDMSDDPESAVESFLEDCGLRMTEYFQFGEKLGIEPIYCVVEAETLDHA